MVIKYKLSDFAKDIDTQNKVVVDLLSEKFGEVKKHTTPLSEEELDYLFDFFTRKAEEPNFEAYLAVAPKRKIQEAKPTQDKAQEIKTKADKPAAVNAQEKVATPANRPAPNTEANKSGATTVSKKSAPSGVKPTQPQKAQPQKAQPQSAQPQSAQPQSAQTQNAQPQKAQPQNSQPQAVQQQGAQANRPKQQPAKKRDGLGRIREVKNDQTQKPAAPKREVVTRTIDTRTVDVNLDKFNEKYTDMASAKAVENRKKPTQNRQKLRTNKARQNPYAKKKETEAERLQRIQLEKARKAQLKVSIPDEITVGDLATRLKAAAPQVIKVLMGYGVMASVSQVVDFDTASAVAEEMGAKVEREVHVTIEERLFEVDEDHEGDLYARPPVVVVMGHVDHGKTSILDAIRATNVTEGEAGGITQHIGAYQVKKDDKPITFLDTPGHEAFTSMRARGATMTDIAVLVVAADDGIMPQTIESINHAKAAGVSILVAVNKMDKEGANPDRVKQQLTEHELVPEEWGGDVVVVPVSAHTGQGIDELLEMINLTAEMMELKANPVRKAKGAVVEARLDKGQGPIATILVQRGTLRQGDIILAGTSVGRVRTMRDSTGKSLEEAGPSMPVEITGLTDVPEAGDIFDAVQDERLARELADRRSAAQREEQLGSYTKVTLDNLFSQIAAGDMKQFSIVVKADVQGSAEAVKQSLEKISNEEVRVKVVHAGVGAISKSDVMLADASGAIIIGFNVRPDLIATADAAQNGVEMRMYRVIYDAINDVEDAMKGMLAPKIREIELGRIEVRETYKVSSVGTIAGCYVQNGKVNRNAQIRVVRDGIVVAEDEISSLRRFKDDVKEVAQGYECGISLAKYSDIKEGDIFEAFQMEEYRD